MKILPSILLFLLFSCFLYSKLFSQTENFQQPKYVYLQDSLFLKHIENPYKIIVNDSLGLPVDSGKSVILNEPKSDTTSLDDFYLLEKLLDEVTDDTRNSELLEQIDDYRRNPVDINTATKEEIDEIPFVTSLIASRIVEYRKINGKYKSKRELKKVIGIDENLYKKIKFFVFAGSTSEDYVKEETGTIIFEKESGRTNVGSSFKLQFRNYISHDLKISKGFENGNYLGTIPKVYNRLRLLYKEKNFLLNGGITLEKDKGEQSLTDFYSGFIETNLNISGVSVNIVAGDYSLNFGQGVGLWTSVSYIKGSEAVSIVKKKPSGLSPYRSTSEIQFFRGAALNIMFKNFGFYMFYSDNSLDATIDTTLNAVKGFYYDGYHRTINEKNRSNAVEEIFSGARLSYSGEFGLKQSTRNIFGKGYFKTGITYWRSKYSKDVITDSTKELYNFSGNKAEIISADADFGYGNINIFGEAARSQSGAIAGVGGIQIVLGKPVSLIFLYRNYPENFTPVHSFGFGESNGNTRNETGFYTGLSLNPFSGLSVNLYFDQFRFPYRTYYNPVPTTGNDFLADANLFIKKGFMVSLKIKNKNKEERIITSDEEGRQMGVIDNRNQFNLRCGFVYDFSGKFLIGSRAEFTNVNYKNTGMKSRGYLFYSDIKISLIKKIVLSSRIAFFQTDNYDSRIYEYEEEVRGIVSNVALYGKGVRWYLVLRAKILNSVEFSFKYSATRLEGVTFIGSGNELIGGDLDDRINAGIDINF